MFSGGRGGSMRYDHTKYKIVKEVDGDLFEAPKEYSLAHCVATDMRMGSGIAVNFRYRNSLNNLYFIPDYCCNTYPIFKTVYKFLG
jgi:hypothetical protein